jgi:hypothetical protein
MNRTTSEKASFSNSSAEAHPLITAPRDAEVQEAGPPRCSRPRRILPVITGLILGLAFLVVIHGCKYLNLLKEAARSIYFAARFEHIACG